MRRTATTSALALSLVILLSGCTIATTLAGGGGAGGGDTEPGITVSDGYTPDPVAPETEKPDEPEETVPEWVEQTDIQVALGESIDIEGRSGNTVGTFQVDSVDPTFDACTAADYEPTEWGQYVQVNFTVTATDELAAEDGSWDYPQYFSLYLADIVGPGGEYLSNSLGFDCMRISEWNDEVEPGETIDGVIYLEVERFGEAGMVEWDYGHQNFQVPFP